MVVLARVAVRHPHEWNMQETCSAELLAKLETSFAAALQSVSAAMPGQDLRMRGWAPAEPLQAFLHAVERLTEMQGPRNHTVLMCVAPRSHFTRQIVKLFPQIRLAIPYGNFL